MAPKAKVGTKPEEKKAPAAAEEPEAKKAKTEEAKPAKEEEVEKEKDAAADSRPGIKPGAVFFETSDTTLNVIQTSGGRVLMPFTDAGMQSLVAAARSNIGVKAGRYMYEASIIESFSTGGGWGAKQILRVGFSTTGSSLIHGDGDDGIYFDSDGGCFVGKKRVGSLLPGKKLARDSVAGVVLNLDPKTENVNTVSLFVSGARASAPIKLPEELIGKTLYPHICFRSVSIQVHFGPEPLRPLPFKCRTVQSAASSDVGKAKAQPLADGKHEVIFPVGFPDEGTFEWLDSFLEKNKQYVELSDRKVIEWAKKSGLNQKGGQAGSNDKPNYNLGVQGLDDFSASKIIKTVAPLVPRNYVVMEVKSNLVESERQATLKKFSSKHFKKSAIVVMGEPSAAHKELVKDKLLKKKQEKLDLVFKQKKAEKERKKLIAQKAREAAERKKKADEARKAKLKELEEKKKKEAEAKGEVKAEEKKEEEEVKKEEETKEEEKPEEKKEEEEEEETEPAKAELTEEEDKIWFTKSSTPDINPKVLEKCFGDFGIPSKSEGFDDIKYEWQKEKASKDYLRNWVLERKRTSRIDNLVPSEWFKGQQAEFTKKVADWQAKQKTAKAAKKPKKADDDDDDVGVDIFSIEDVCNVGNGEPLFLDFESHDWALMTLRWELHLLVTAFKKDVNDPDRQKIPEPHIGFYMQKYFKKNISPKSFGKDSFQDLVKTFVKDTVALDGEPLMFSSNLTEDALPEMFVKLTEEKRRERQRRIDAGDETARLSFTPAGAGGAAAAGKPAEKKPEAKPAEKGAKAAGKGAKK